MVYVLVANKRLHYRFLVAVTDHGFIYWRPEKDEILANPEGEIMWRSRRAIVGRELKHSSAIKLGVPQSELECMVPRSANAFQTYGSMGFFHGGATLQEIVIPVLKAEWPRKAAKIPVVLGPITEILSLSPRVEIRAGSTASLPGIGADPNITGRNVVIKIIEPESGRRLLWPVTLKTIVDCRIETKPDDPHLTSPWSGGGISSDTDFNVTAH